MRIAALIIASLALAARGQISFPVPMPGTSQAPPVKAPSTNPDYRAGSIEGRVLAVDKSPLGGARVFLQKAARMGPISMGNNDEGQPQMVTGPDGVFVFVGVAPGTHMITVMCTGFERNFEVVDVESGKLLGVTILMSRPAPAPDRGRMIGGPPAKQR